jgi:hypothetical protein
MANTDLNGFSVDAPNVVVKTAQGDYSTVTASEATLTFGGDTIKIAGGAGFYSIAEIDKSKTIDIKITDAQYSAQSMALSTGAVITKGADTYDVYGEVYTADETGLITLPKVAIAESLRINGYTEVTIEPITTGTFKVTISADSTEVLFTATEAGLSFSPLYSVAVPNAVTVTGLTTSFPKSGEVRFTYALYSDVLAEESTIIGDMQITIYKCKIIQGYKAGGGVKSAQTFDLSLSAIDPRRNDKQMWKSVFIPIATV